MTTSEGTGRYSRIKASALNLRLPRTSSVDQSFLPNPKREETRRYSSYQHPHPTFFTLSYDTRHLFSISSLSTRATAPTPPFSHPCTTHAYDTPLSSGSANSSTLTFFTSTFFLTSLLSSQATSSLTPSASHAVLTPLHRTFKTRSATFSRDFLRTNQSSR